MQHRRDVRSHKQRQQPRTVSKRGSCSPYGKPDSGDTITAYTETEITWDKDCLDDIDLMDIYLYDVSGDSTTPLHGWSNVPTSDGNLTTIFYPTWWNATKASDRKLQLQYIDSGDPLWASTFSTGPTFTVSWNGTAPPAQVTKGSSWNQSVEAVTNPSNDGGLSKGHMAAAILVPILVAIGAVIGYLFWNRRKSESRPKRWSQAVDKRMSMMSAAGDNWTPPAPRPGSVAWSHMQMSQRGSMAGAPSIRMDGSGHHRGASYASVGSANAAGVGVQRHDRSFSHSSKSGHSAKASLSGEVMKELMGSKRASRFSFAPNSHNTPSRPAPAAINYPRVGQNRVRNSVASSTQDPFQDAQETVTPGFMHGHGAKASVSSSLRNEYLATGQTQLARDSSMSESELAAVTTPSSQSSGSKKLTPDKKRQSHTSQPSPPLSTSSSSKKSQQPGSSRSSGFFAAAQEQPSQPRASSMYSEQDVFTLPSPSLQQPHLRPSPAASPSAARWQAASPDAALAAYSAQAQAAQNQQLPGQPQSPAKKTGASIANFFGRGGKQTTS